MPRKKANAPKEDEEKEPGYIDAYDPDNGLPFDNNSKEVQDKLANEDLEEKDDDVSLPVEENEEISSPISDPDPPKPQVQEADSLTEAELENIIGDDNAIIDQELDQNAIRQESLSNPQQEEEEIKTYGDDPYVGESEEEDEQQQHNENNKTSLIEQLEKEKKYALRLKNIAFLQEYAKATHRTVDEVTNKLGIPLQTGKNFINEYIKVVKRAVENKSYPDDVLYHYNRGISDKEKDKKLKYHQIDALKDIVRKYSSYDVNINLNKRLNNHGNDTFISNHRVALNSPSSNPLSQFSDSPVSHISSGYTSSQDSEIKEIRDGITSLQLIKFGLINAFGQAAKMRISAMIGNDPTPYLTDEQRMKNLLIMAGATEHKAQTFIEWLKTHARYVSQPIGFLNYGLQGYGSGQNRYGMSGGGGGGMMGTPGMNSNGPFVGGGGIGSGVSLYDQSMIDYYYQVGAYLPGLPPDHPINRENLQKWKQEKAQKDQLDAMTRQSEMFMRMQMIKTMSAMGNSESSNKSGSLFTPEMLLVTGMGRYERTGVDEQGKPVYAIVPNLSGTGGVPGAYGGTPGVPGAPAIGPNGLPINPVDQASSTLGLVKEIMQTMQTMQQQTQTQQGSEKSFFNEVMGGLAQRVLAPPPQDNKLKDFVETFEVISKLNGGGGLMGAPVQGAPPPDPMVVLETQRLQNEKEFGLRALQLKEKDMDMKANLAKQSDSESNNNMKWFVSTMSETLGPLLTGGMQFLFNRGAAGGAPGMMPGAPGDMATQPGAMGPGGMNNTALNTIIEMEYAKEERRKKQEAEEKRIQWEEEVRRKEEERNREIAYQRAMNQPGVIQPQPQVFRPQQPPAGVIQEGPSQYENAFTVETPQNKPMVGSNLEDQDITVDTFLPHSVDIIQANLEKAVKHKQFLERYIANAEEAVNEKIANGEPVSTPTDAFGIPLDDKTGQQRQQQQDNNTWDPTVIHREETTVEMPDGSSYTEEETTQFIEKNNNDINQFLQSFPSEAVDPDYDGPKDEEIEDLDKKTVKDDDDSEEKEIDI